MRDVVLFEPVIAALEVRRGEGFVQAPFERAVTSPNVDAADAARGCGDEHASEGRVDDRVGNLLAFAAAAGSFEAIVARELPVGTRRDSDRAREKPLQISRTQGNALRELVERDPLPGVVEYATGLHDPRIDRRGFIRAAALACAKARSARGLHVVKEPYVAREWLPACAARPAIDAGRGHGVEASGSHARTTLKSKQV